MFRAGGRQKAIIPQTTNIRKCQHIRLSVESSFLRGRGTRREVETAVSPNRRSELVESLKYVHKVLTQLFLLKEINLFAQSCIIPIDKHILYLPPGSRKDFSDFLFCITKGHSLQLLFISSSHLFTS